MSSFKQLNKADITTVPYAANKRWNLNETVSNDKINIFKGTYTTGSFSSSEPTFNGQYERLVYDSINHMFYQSYNGSLLNTGSLMFNTTTYESASQQRPTGAYFDYNTNPLLIKNFPTGAGATIKIIAVNPKVYGSKVLPNSFSYQSGSTINITDDGYGNLYNTGSVHVGNIFYAHGLAVITNQSSSYQNSTGSVSFQNEHIIYENEVRCIVRESDFNLSYNPSLLKYGATLTTASVDITNITVSSSTEYVNIQSFPFILDEGYIKTTITLNTSLPQDTVIQYIVDYSVPPGFPSSYQISGSVTIPAGNLSNSSTYLVPFSFGFPSPDQIVINSVTITSTAYKQYELIDSTIKDFATGSFFQPYTTTIGLYNDNNDLLMVAKLGKPIALSSDTDMTFIVKYDT
jgi:hypothetical protein